MRPFIKLALLLLLPVFLKGQPNPLFTVIPKAQLDSFRSMLKTTSNDTLRMELFRKLSYYYLEVNRDSFIVYAEQRLALANQLKLKLWQVEGYDLLGVAYNYLGNYPKSLQAFLEGLKIAEDEESEKHIWRISQFTTDRNPRAARLNALSAIYLDMGNLYGNTGNIDKQMSSFYKGIAIAESINNYTVLSLINMDLGLAYLNLNNLDSALVIEQKALTYSDAAVFLAYKGLILSNLGSIYSKKGDYRSAKKYFTESIQTSQEQNNNSDLGAAYVSFANLYLHEEAFDSSLYYARKGLENYKIVGAPDGMLKAFSCLYAIYKSQENTDSALHYLQLATSVKDSLYNTEKAKQFQNIGFDEQLKVQELEKEKIENRNKISTYTMSAGIAVFMVIAFLLYRNSRNRKKANTQLSHQKDELQATLNELKATQAQLIQSEKMASLGQLTAGIAHEIQNPLNFVNNFSEINTELIEELKSELVADNKDEALLIANDIKENEQKIIHHGKRAGAIVNGMLQHSRASSGRKEWADINALVDESLRLSYHGLRAKNKDFNATINTDFDANIGKINIIPQDISRVLLNLFNNAFYAINEKKSKLNGAFEPTVSVCTKKQDGKVEIHVKDNGNGIPQNIVDKIFQPFFTTKPTGEGTGLGLSLSYDIIKAHGGELMVNSKEGEGASFTFELPV